MAGSPRFRHTTVIIDSPQLPVHRSKFNNSPWNDRAAQDATFERFHENPFPATGKRAVSDPGVRVLLTRLRAFSADRGFMRRETLRVHRIRSQAHPLLTA